VVIVTALAHKYLINWVTLSLLSAWLPLGLGGFCWKVRLSCYAPASYYQLLCSGLGTIMQY